MLVLTRKTQESVLIGDDIKVVIIDSGKNRVRLGISAPSEVVITRTELAGKLQQASRPGNPLSPACPEPVLAD